MYKVNDPTDFRSKISKHLIEILETESLGNNLEKGIYNYSLKHATKINVVKKWDNTYFVKIYLNRLRTIINNLQMKN